MQLLKSKAKIYKKEAVFLQSAKKMRTTFYFVLAKAWSIAV